MLVMEDAKLPPPNPPSAATIKRVVSETPGCRTIAAAMVGMSSRAALMIVQLRPPNFATAKVYGSRLSEPTSVGVETSRNLSAADNPYFGPMKRTITDHSVQIEKPMCSAVIENHRFRLATFFPVVAQNSSFSGSQCSIQREPRRVAVVVIAVSFSVF